MRELEIAWNCSDKQEQALANELRTARQAAERAKNPPPEPTPQPDDRDSGSAGGRVDWTKIITDIIIHSMDKG